MPAGEYVITKTNTATSNTVLDLTNGTVIRNDCPAEEILLIHQVAIMVMTDFTILH